MHTNFFKAIIYNIYSKANSITSSNNSEYLIPTCSKSFGYILILVKPGKVLISFIYTFSVPFSIKKSTLDKPLPSIDLKAFTDNFLISSDFSSEISAGINVFDYWFLYFAS